MDEYEPITGELRSYIRKATSTSDNCWWTATDTQSVRDLCDNIDSVHAELERDYARVKAERDSMAAALDAAQGEHAYAPESHYMMLPKDEDGVPIHVGDVMEWATGETFEVVGIGDGGTLYYAEDGQVEWTNAERKRHHTRTVEDVLTEFAAKLIERGGLTNGAAQTIAEYVDKLRLADGKE